MKLLFDLYHPSHVHLFKHAIWTLEDEGHDVLVTARDTEMTIDLLTAYDLDHVVLSAKRSGRLGRIREAGTRFVKLVRTARSFDPDIVAARINPLSVYAAKACGARSIMFKDSDYLNLASKVSHPFVDVMYIPANFDLEFGTMEHRVDGFQELAYLHPDWFEPDPAQLRAHGIDPQERYFVVRFVAMDAHHDTGHHGFSPAMKKRIVSRLDEAGTVYITSEDELPPVFEPYRLPIPPSAIHHLLAFADIYVGDSQTMATEAAVLGTPAIRSNTFANGDDLSNFIELEETYGLLHSFGDEAAAFDHLETLLAREDLQAEWDDRRARLIEDKVDITADMLALFRREGS